jgi:hypothetical protein
MKRDRAGGLASACSVVTESGMAEYYSCRSRKATGRIAPLKM